MFWAFSVDGHRSGLKAALRCFGFAALGLKLSLRLIFAFGPSVLTSLVAQGIDGIELRCFAGRVEAEEDADGGAESKFG